MAAEEYLAVAGSERPPLPGAEVSGELDPSEPVEVTVVLRPSERAAGLPGTDELGAVALAERSHLSRDELARERGARPDDLAAVRAFADGHGLDVVEADAAGRRVVLSGTVASMGAAFGVRLVGFVHPGGTYRGHDGPARLPAALAGAVVAVLGLDDRPQASPRFRPRARPSRSYTPVEVGAAYGFPASTGSASTGTAMGGAGRTIAFVELGGGYNEADLASYFGALGLPVPAVEAVGVDGAANAPTGDASGPDGEVMLDLEVAGALAPGARLVCYFAPNTDRGFVDAISAAVHDAARSPEVVSISWGGPEESYTAQARAAFEAVLADAAAAGVTVCVAAGDNGSSDGVNDGLAHVDYPAASPQVLGCGGTRLLVAAGILSSEVVWNDQPLDGATGGGVSAAFPLPSWQASAKVPLSANPGGGAGRGVPDVAGNADPDTGYRVRVDGADTVVGGTSAVAPLFAALVTLAGARVGRGLGFLNPLWYDGSFAAAFRDVTVGTNGAYRAGTGWDACTGLGSPKAPELLARLG